MVNLVVSTSLNLPSAELEYLAQLATRVQASLGELSLIALYLFGSAARGSPIYEPGISDLDVQAVIQSPLPVVRYTSLASDVSHSSLPCPATKLEFVVYTRDEAQAAAARSPRYELNLNTGRSQKDDLSLDWKADARHWFLLDVAAGREVAVPIFGPPAVDIFGEPNRGIVLEALKESLEWHADQERGPNGVANAARAWRWVREGIWGSKMEGVEWGITRDAKGRWRGLLSAVSLARSSGVELDAASVRSFLQMVMCEVENAIELQKG